jgi:transposase-like protein
MTKTEIEAAIYLYTELGLNSRQIGAVLKRSKTTVLKYISPAVNIVSQSIPTDTVAAWIDLFNKGLSSRGIAKLYHVSHRTVLNRLNAAGIDTSSYSQTKGTVYVIKHIGIPIYVGYTQYSLEHRLQGHIAKSHNRIGGLAKFINDAPSAIPKLSIHPLRRDVPIKYIKRIELYWIKQLSAQYNLLNIIGNNQQ